MDPIYPDVEVRLSGRDGNVFAIIARVGAALKRAGHAEAAAEFRRRATEQKSYDDVLRLCMDTVAVS